VASVFIAFLNKIHEYFMKILSGIVIVVQRMGRTGRKREGRIVVLVTEGAEERKYNTSLISKKTINKAILDKEKLASVLYQQAPRYQC
jgi:ERCC4-related helicase